MGKLELLNTFLKNAAVKGWNQAALQSATHDLAIPPLEARRLFPDGLSELADYYIDEINNSLSSRYAQEAENGWKLSQKVAFALKLRFAIMAEHKKAISKLQSFLILPQNISHATRMLFRTADHIWYLVGDRSTDFNFYTKRISLAAIYGSAILFWLNDHSENHIETAAFIDRQLQRHVSFHNFKKHFLTRIAYQRNVH